MAGLIARIILHNESIENYFRQAESYLDAKFHTHPNVFPDRDISPQEAVEMAGRDALVRGIVAATSPSSVPKGNQVV